jgi:hypothetical protein
MQQDAKIQYIHPHVTLLPSESLLPLDSDDTFARWGREVLPLQVLDTPSQAVSKPRNALRNLAIVRRYEQEIVLVDRDEFREREESRSRRI